MLNLGNVTLIIVDCLNDKRAINAIDICTKNCSFASVKFLTSLKTESKYRISIPHIGSLKEYSDFILKDIYQYVDTKYMLIIQHDGYILNPESWDNEFYNYDYIGAPWKRYNEKNVGNGGFSLRTKRIMEHTSKLFKSNRKYDHEDFTICIDLRGELINSGFTFAPIDLAAKFSVDCNYYYPYLHTFGFHRLACLNKITLEIGNRNE